MKKLCMVLCVMIMFFGIVGCPSSDDLTPGVSKSSYSSTTVASNEVPAAGGNYHAAPEPATLILLGSGLVGLAGIGRKKFFKKD